MMSWSEAWRTTIGLMRKRGKHINAFSDQVNNVIIAANNMGSEFTRRVAYERQSFDYNLAQCGVREKPEDGDTEFIDGLNLFFTSMERIGQALTTFAASLHFHTSEPLKFLGKEISSLQASVNNKALLYCRQLDQCQQSLEIAQERRSIRVAQLDEWEEERRQFEEKKLNGGIMSLPYFAKKTNKKLTVKLKSALEEKSQATDEVAIRAEAAKLAANELETKFLELMNEMRKSESKVCRVVTESMLAISGAVEENVEGLRDAAGHSRRGANIIRSVLNQNQHASTSDILWVKSNEAQEEASKRYTQAANPFADEMPATHHLDANQLWGRNKSGKSGDSGDNSPTSRSTTVAHKHEVAQRATEKGVFGNRNNVTKWEEENEQDWHESYYLDPIKEEDTPRVLSKTSSETKMDKEEDGQQQLAAEEPRYNPGQRLDDFVQSWKPSPSSSSSAPIPEQLIGPTKRNERSIASSSSAPIPEHLTGPTKPDERSIASSSSGPIPEQLTGPTKHDEGSITSSSSASIPKQLTGPTKHDEGSIASSSIPPIPEQRAAKKRDDGESPLTSPTSSPALRLSSRNAAPALGEAADAEQLRPSSTRSGTSPSPIHKESMMGEATAHITPLNALPEDDKPKCSVGTEHFAIYSREHSNRSSLLTGDHTGGVDDVEEDMFYVVMSQKSPISNAPQKEENAPQKDGERIQQQENSDDREPPLIHSRSFRECMSGRKARGEGIFSSEEDEVGGSTLLRGFSGSGLIPPLVDAYDGDDDSDARCKQKKEEDTGDDFFPPAQKEELEASYKSTRSMGEQGQGVEGQGEEFFSFGVPPGQGQENRLSPFSAAATEKQEDFFSSQSKEEDATSAAGLIPPPSVRPDDGDLLSDDPKNKEDVEERAFTTPKNKEESHFFAPNPGSEQAISPSKEEAISFDTPEVKKEEQNFFNPPARSEQEDLFAASPTKDHDVISSDAPSIKKEEEDFFAASPTKDHDVISSNAPSIKKEEENFFSAPLPVEQENLFADFPTKESKSQKTLSFDDTPSSIEREEEMFGGIDAVPTKNDEEKDTRAFTPPTEKEDRGFQISPPPLLMLSRNTTSPGAHLERESQLTYESGELHLSPKSNKMSNARAEENAHDGIIKDGRIEDTGNKQWKMEDDDDDDAFFRIPNTDVEDEPPSIHGGVTKRDDDKGIPQEAIGVPPPAGVADKEEKEAEKEEKEAVEEEQPETHNPISELERAQTPRLSDEEEEGMNMVENMF